MADSIFISGTILTLNKTDEVAQAVAVKNGNILAVGSDSEIAHFIGDETQVVNLQGSTLIPGFYDAHSHFVMTGMVGLYQINLNSPPIGTVESIENIIALLEEKANNIPAGDWIEGFGYDDTLLVEGRHPTRDDLDRASTEHPILITHTSGHLAVANSLALELAGITNATPQPEGGVIRKDEDGEPTGVLDEPPAFDQVGKLIPAMTTEQMLAAIRYASDIYAAKGVTTANSGLASIELISLLKMASEQDDLLNVHVIAWPTLEDSQQAYDLALNNDKLIIGGIKEVADGSIQGYSGYLSEPYYTPFNGDADYRGYPRHDREKLADRIMKIHSAGRQVFLHANGDAAIDDALYAFRKAQEAFPREDTRHTLIHAQMAREDQLDEMAELGLIPSFFQLHTYYWGDRHRDIFMGPERAFRMSPTKSAADRGMRFTIHTDTPVVPMDPMLMIWSAVNRVSTSGQVIGREQSITALEALRATTINSAFQNFEDHIKGSIEPGKLADFTILAENPLKVDPIRIKDIQILEAIVGGDSIYKTML
ncbi:amidohydrolase [Shewanella sp. VB17]|nr:amidohydrolase [Shewanella sp. VB17]